VLAPIIQAIQGFFQRLIQDSPTHLAHLAVEKMSERRAERERAEAAQAAAIQPDACVQHGGVKPIGLSCPTRYPIKGSSSNIYHLPGGQFYDDTNPVLCFPTEEDAKAAGFRTSQRG
jgi:hypothetical protein